MAPRPPTRNGLHPLRVRAVFVRAWRPLLAHRGGATAIEYGLIVALIAVVMIAGLSLVGNGLNTVFGAVSNNLNVQ